MSRLIDADKLEPHEIYEDNGFTEVVYMDDIREMPTVDAEPIRCGQWNKEEDTLFRLCVYKCSLCGGEVLSEAYLFKYCPYCGCAIKMEVEEDEVN